MLAGADNLDGVAVASTFLSVSGLFPTVSDPEVCSPGDSSMAVTGVVFIPPMMILIPAFCTLVSLLVLDSAAVAQADDPYSTTGLTAPVYSCWLPTLFQQAFSQGGAFLLLSFQLL